MRDLGRRAHAASRVDECAMVAAVFPREAKGLPEIVRLWWGDGAAEVAGEDDDAAIVDVDFEMLEHGRVAGLCYPGTGDEDCVRRVLGQESNDWVGY